MACKLERVYVSIPKAAADALVRGAHRYSVPTLAATLVCRHFGIAWNPRPNGRKLWKLKPEEIEARRRHEDEYKARSGKHAYVKIADLPEDQRKAYLENKERQRRQRHETDGHEVWDLTIDETHYCRLSHPKEWDDLPRDVRERLLRNMYVRRHQKKVRDMIKAANEELRSRRRDEDLSPRNLHDVGIQAEHNCAECAYYDGIRCARFGMSVEAGMLCDDFRSIFG